MFWEILFGLLIAVTLLYLFYIYLEWCNDYSFAKLIYSSNPSVVVGNDKNVIETYGSLMMPEYLSDTYKPIRFWILYYQSKYL